MGQQSHETPRLIVVGVPAGGIEPLERLLLHLAPSFPAPIVVVGRGTAGTDWLRADGLAPRSPLPIHSIDNPVKMEPGNVYAALDGRNVTIEGNTVQISGEGDGAPIDLLFASAAGQFGEDLIAVILAGIGHDGPSGVRAVKERGGMVVAEDADGSDQASLPPPIPYNHVDFASNADGLGDLLLSLAADRPASADVNDPDVLSAFLSQLRGRSGIDFRQYKMPTIVRRLSRLMSGARSKSLAEYLRYLNANPEAYQRLVSAFLIKVTGFFRDPALFAHLRERVLPAIVSRAKQSGEELRFWSAGCATGEEAYSIAILLAEVLGDEVDEFPIRIFATDLDADAIAFARRGIYPAGALSEMPPEYLSKYFTPVGSAYQVRKRIRNLTVFGEYDLGQRAPFPRIDMILCRNVLIYFTRELQQRTLQLFAFSLREGGCLVLGKAETANPLPQYFVPEDQNLKVFRRQGERLLIPAPASSNNASLRERPSVRRNALRSTPVPRRSLADTAPRWSLTERLGSFLFDSPIGVVVVDRNYDILTLNQSARALLAIHGQGIGDDLVHLTSAPNLKNWLDAAFRSELPTTDEELAIEDPATNEVRHLQISCYPDKTANKDGRIEGVIVVVTDATRAVKRRRQLQAENDGFRESADRAAQQNEQLLTRQRILIEANNELSAANNELRSANEHLLIAAEEAEASSEEVETLNEEMQATSEELETLNEELQATVEELNTTNEELAARSAELERLAIERQTRLSDVHEMLALHEAALEELRATVCLIRDGCVAAVSKRYASLQALNPSVLAALSEPWKDVPSAVKLSLGNGQTGEYRSKVKRAGGSVSIVTLEAS